MSMSIFTSEDFSNVKTPVSKAKIIKALMHAKDEGNRFHSEQFYLKLLFFV